MGTARRIVKLLSSQNEDDRSIGHELLKGESYYEYMLEYMSEVINNKRIWEWKLPSYTYPSAISIGNMWPPTIDLRNNKRGSIYEWNR